MDIRKWASLPLLLRNNSILHIITHQSFNNKLTTLPPLKKERWTREKWKQEMLKKKKKQDTFDTFGTIVARKREERRGRLKKKKRKKRAILLNRRITSDLGQQRNEWLSVSVSSGVGAVKRILLGCPAINFAGFRRTGQKNRPRDSWNREPISDLALFSKPLFSARCRSN